MSKSAPIQLTAGDPHLSGGISAVAMCSSTLRTMSSLRCGDRRTCRVSVRVTVGDWR